MGLDLPTSILCLTMALAFSVLHILSSPKHGRWLTLPWYVRLGFMLTAVGMLYRGFDLFNLARPQASTISLGHIDKVGFVLTLSMAFSIGGLAIHALLNGYSPAVRARIERIEHLAMVKPHGGALATLALDGATVVEPMGKLPDP